MNEENLTIEKSKPLWMPEGSVRAILVLGSLLTVLIPVLVFVFRKEDIPQSVKEVIIFIAGSTTGLIKDYITGRREENNEVKE